MQDLFATPSRRHVPVDHWLLRRLGEAPCRRIESNPHPAVRLSLTEEASRAFVALADAQRGVPEDAMTEAQYALGGGVLSYVIEHVGDLNHRMNVYAGEFNHDAGYGYVKDKAEKSLRYLRQSYGFRREHRENMERNAEYHGVPLSEYIGKARRALLGYAAAHAALPVYTMGQKLAQDAAIALGEERFEAAAYPLERILSRMGTEEEWVEFAWFSPLENQ